MRIIIAGYGKMGHQIEEIAIERGHSVVARLTSKEENIENLKALEADVVVEFTSAQIAPDLIIKFLDLGIPVVSGTTGWNDQLSLVKEKALSDKRSFFYASNYSIGMNLFAHINKQLAHSIGKISGYKASIHEIHHIHKKDAPSGTAITLAEGIVKSCDRYDSWGYETEDENKLNVTSERTGEVPGTHIVTWKSEADTIDLIHTAHSRKGFALGAIIAAEWILGKTGVFGMEDLLTEIVEK